MGAKCVGTPLGGMTHADAYAEHRRKGIYSIILDLVRELAAVFDRVDYAEVERFTQEILKANRWPQGGGLP